MEKKNNRRFYVIQGGPESELEGPATRLGLYERFPKTDRKHLALVLFTKVALLAGMLYFILGKA